MRLASLVKPHYFFQPRLLLRRLLGRNPASGRVLARLPGGCLIEILTADDIGAAVLRLGVFDLTVTEVLWRLCDIDDVVVDAGANIGYMTAVMASRISAGGTVYSFEPHPQLFTELCANIQRCQMCLGSAITFIPRQVALSDAPATVRLRSFDDSSGNRGTSTIVADAAAVDGAQFSVRAVRLEDELDNRTRVGVMKVDVEGHELALLHGVNGMLRQHRIRDIIFEEHRAYPTDVTSLLESYGFALFRLARSFFGPRLVPPESRTLRSNWEATSFLATADPERARKRLAPLGWRCLSG